MIHAQFSVIETYFTVFLYYYSVCLLPCSCVLFQRQITLISFCYAVIKMGLVHREGTWGSSSYINTLIQAVMTSSRDTDWPRSRNIISIQFSLSWADMADLRMKLCLLICRTKCAAPNLKKSGSSSTMTWRGFRYWWIHNMCTKETKGE